MGLAEGSDALEGALRWRRGARARTELHLELRAVPAAAVLAVFGHEPEGGALEREEGEGLARGRVEEQRGGFGGDGLCREIANHLPAPVDGDSVGVVGVVQVPPEGEPLALRGGLRAFRGPKAPADDVEVGDCDELCAREER